MRPMQSADSNWWPWSVMIVVGVLNLATQLVKVTVIIFLIGNLGKSVSDSKKK